MEKIGQKIKRIRQEKGFTQENIYKTNQSLIAQIEGKNYKSNPMSSTLKKIAEGLEISFSDLIKDTDWKEVSPRLNRDEFLISEMNFDVSMEGDGTIKVIFEEYPRYDTDGEQNRFCPTSGFELVTKCKACGKKFLNSSQVFCMGCGERLFFKYEQHFDELGISDKSFLLINKNGRKLADAMDELDKIISNQKEVEKVLDSVFDIKNQDLDYDKEFISELSIFIENFNFARKSLFVFFFN